MARLQDFPSVTPTSSDKILIVQSQGQGLAPHTIKLDSANPTGTGSLSLNRKANTTVGGYSVAEGYNCEASNNQCHAEGYNTKASGQRSHAEGEATVASGSHAHAENASNTASGDRTHAEGSGTTASGYASHAENQNTTASGQDSHAEGLGTIANHAMQHVFGLYNVADTSTAAATSRGNYVEIVGNGENSANRSNARTLDWSGNEVLAGDLTINGDTSVGNILKYIGHIIFNSSSPAVIPKLTGGYGIYIVFGVFAGVTIKTLQISIGNNSIGSILDMTTGSAWSSSSYTFSYSSSTGLKIESSVSANSEISYIKSA